MIGPPKAMKLESAEQCFQNSIDYIESSTTIEHDYIDHVFGRTWVFCKCREGQVANCDSAFRETIDE